ncbi:MAG: 16S rRNA (cytidine(1402)-2'-O)-methyltransferase [Hydrogenophilus sp.]|nr:16S rRNA (cytidine(1402)-2'-O)-methyltransferase [Hydrogenophilus sp.]
MRHDLLPERLEGWRALAGAAQWRLPTPALYVVATPLGNRFDVSLRALAVLDGVDGIAAENPRVSSRLLAMWGIERPMVRLFAHNEVKQTGWLVQRLQGGESWALISDAGTPGISDPGGRVVQGVRAAGFPVVVIPGPSAVTSAVALSGFGEEGFCFGGFLPSRRAQRRSTLARAAGGEVPMVWFEAPHRIAETLVDVVEVLGEAQPLFVGRELTKAFEEVFVGRAGEAVEWLRAREERRQGEFVLVVPPAAEREREEGWRRAEAWFFRFRAAGVAMGVAARWAAELGGVPRGMLYGWALEREEREKGREGERQMARKRKEREDRNDGEYGEGR